MRETLMTALQVVLTFFVSFVAGYIVQFLKTKAEEARSAAEKNFAVRCMGEIADAVATAVQYVAQTYVDELKKSDTFSKDNQTEALNMAIDKALSLLTEDATNYLKEKFDDVAGILATKVEAQVRALK
jgi:uncharacterized membrane protein YraQ (UPF0718 family)